MILKFLKSPKDLNSPLGVKLQRNKSLLDLLEKCEGIFSKGEKITFAELEKLYTDLIVARYAGSFLTAILNQILEFKIVNTELQFICGKLKLNLQPPETNENEDTNEWDEETDCKSSKKKSKKKASKKPKRSKSKKNKVTEAEDKSILTDEVCFEAGYQTDCWEKEESTHYSRIDKWRHVLSKRISLINFTSIFERAKNMIVKVYFWDKTIQKITDRWEKFKQNCTDLIRNSENTKKGNQVIDIIHEGLNWNVVDFDVVIEAINKFSESQKLWDLYSKYFDPKAINILFDEYESFIDVIYPDLKSKGVLSHQQISKINEDFKKANAIIKKLNTFKSKKIKDIQKFIDENIKF